MIGKGFFTRDPSTNPPAVRSILNKIGDETIKSIQLVRTPLSKISKFLLNIASFGQLNEKLKDENIDELFHLSMLINGKYELDKQEVIKLVVNPKAITDKSQTLDIAINDNITINELLTNTLGQMGANYGSYNAVSNNCSVFISNVLSSNNLSNNNSDEFLNQKTIELFSKFPSISSKIVNLGTDIGAIADRQIYGEGLATYNYNLPRCQVKFI